MTQPSARVLSFCCTPPLPVERFLIGSAWFISTTWTITSDRVQGRSGQVLDRLIGSPENQGQQEQQEQQQEQEQQEQQEQHEEGF